MPPALPPAVRGARRFAPWTRGGHGSGGRSGAGTSATRCRGTARASTGSWPSARRSPAGRSTATSSRRCATAASRSGPGTLFEPNVWITAPAPARIRIGEGTFLNIGVMVASAALVEIGSHCMLANGCFVTDGNHRFDDPARPVTWQGFTSKGPTRIGDNVWCGANVVVTSGVTIGERSRDRRQQRRDDRHPAAVDRGRGPGARAADDRVRGGHRGLRDGRVAAAEPRPPRRRPDRNRARRAATGLARRTPSALD